MTAFWTMNPMTRNICIYFSDTGGGHRSAADAVEAGIRELLARCPDASDVNIIKETIAEKSHPVNRKFVELQLFAAPPSAVDEVLLLVHPPDTSGLRTQSALVRSISIPAS
jgi:hypothetical protein